MKEQRNSRMAFLIILAALVSAAVRAATFTTSLPLEPAELVVPFGETVTVNLPGGLLDLPELPDNEYYGNVSYEYHWSVEGGPSGNGRTATIPSSAAGGSGVIASVALQTLPGCYSGQVTARIMETHLINERMGSFSFGDGGSLYLRLQQKIAPASDYEQVWLEASGSGANGTFSPLNEDWSYADRDILVEIYRGDTMLVRLPVKLKTLMKLTSFSPTVTDGKVDPTKVNPYADAITIGYDFANESPLSSAQHGYGLRIPYELSETVKTETGKPFFKIEGTGLSSSPAVPANLLKRKGLVYYYEVTANTGEPAWSPGSLSNGRALIHPSVKVRRQSGNILGRPRRATSLPRQERSPQKEHIKSS